MPYHTSYTIYIMHLNYIIYRHVCLISSHVVSSYITHISCKGWDVMSLAAETSGTWNWSCFFVNSFAKTARSLCFTFRTHATTPAHPPSFQASPQRPCAHFFWNLSSTSPAHPPHVQGTCGKVEPASYCQLWRTGPKDLQTTTHGGVQKQGFHLRGIPAILQGDKPSWLIWVKCRPESQ